MKPGLYEKFRVRKYDKATNAFVELSDFVFVLRPERDPAAMEAMRAYACAVAHTNPRLAWDIVRMFPDLQASLLAHGPPMPDEVWRDAKGPSA